MINFRNLLKKPFDNKAPNNAYYQDVQMLNTYSPYIMAENNNIYDNLLIRACIDTVAKHTAKLTATVKGTNSARKNKLTYLLQNRPNPYMNAYDFIYKIVSQTLTNNNAFIFINYDFDTYEIEGLYPVPFSQVEFLECQGEMFCKFFFKSGASQVILPYADLIHIRRHFNQDDLVGSNQDLLLRPTLTLFRSIIEGFVNSVRASSSLRGYLKYTGNLNPNDLKSYKERFVKDYMSNMDGDGIGALDSKVDFNQIKIDPYTIDDKNQTIANKQIYTYFGVSEDILTGKYNEDTYNAFYNSTIEPLAIQLSEEFTNKLFTEKEIRADKKIIFSSVRLTFANNSTKATICKEMLQLGIFTPNECRKIFELDEIEGGDIRLVSLNYVQADKANEYQGVSDNKSTKEENKNDENL